MTEHAAAQLRRILHIIPQLADDRAHSLPEIAERVGVDAETIREDLWSLVTRFQEPGGFVESVQLYLESDRVSLVSNHFRRPNAAHRTGAVCAGAGTGDAARGASAG